MKREPRFFSVFKLVMGLLALFFLFMMWWSLNEQEGDLKSIKETLRQIESRQKNAPSFPSQQGTNKAAQSTSTPPLAIGDPAIPNILEEDPYFDKVLPEQLGPNFIPSGTFHSATIAKPDNLHPFSNYSEVSRWISLCTISVARQKIGIFETNSPFGAVKMEELKVDPPEYKVYLRPNVYWQPLDTNWFPAGFNLAPQFLEKHPVTAYDYKFNFDAFMNLSVAETGAVASRTLYEDIKEIEVIDDLTFIVRWKSPLYISKLLTGGLSPLPSFVYKYFADGEKIIQDDTAQDAYQKNPIWALNFSNHWAKNIIVSCGAWIFDGMSDQAIRFKRNPDHFFPLDALTDKKEYVIRFSPDTIWQDFKEERLDVYELRPEQLLELNQFLKSSTYQAQNSTIEQLQYPRQLFSYLGWNQDRVLFQSNKVRQALTMSIDRDRIIRQSLNGLGLPIHGMFLSTSKANDPSIQPWPFDPIRARTILEQEGWFDQNGEGTIGKNIDGKWTPFRFSLTYYVKSPTAKTIAEYIATALGNVGIKVDLNGVDVADLTKVFEDKSFDALMMAWVIGSPPQQLSQLWSSKEADIKGSSNAFGFRNKEADEIIEKLDFERDPERRTALYRRFDRILHEEQPYTFLYSPITTLLYRSWMKNIFIPERRQDLIPGADVLEPELSVSWIGENR